jgi:hypothetical protein
MAKKELKQDMPAKAPAKIFAAPAQPKVDFEAWWAVVSKKMPSQHRKEIVMADFTSRGLSKKESTGVYNKALEQYGVKLK